MKRAFSIDCLHAHSQNNAIERSLLKCLTFLKEIISCHMCYQYIFIFKTSSFGFSCKYRFKSRLNADELLQRLGEHSQMYVSCSRISYRS